MLATSISGPCITSGRLSLEADEGGFRNRHGFVRDERGSRCEWPPAPDPRAPRLSGLASPLPGVVRRYLDLGAGWFRSSGARVGVTGGPGCVLGAAVPEAAIDE